MRKAKMFIACIFSATVLFMLSGCLLTKYSSSYYNTRWTAQEINMYFDVLKDEHDIGVIEVNGVSVEFVAVHGAGSIIEFYPTESNTEELLSQLSLDIEGCLFYANEVDTTEESFRLINIDENGNDILPDGITEIHFTSEDID